METRLSKEELMSGIETGWRKLNDTLGRLTPEQMTDIRNAEGWAVKDHLVHIAAWERSVASYMRGGTRYEGLGVDEQVWDSGEDDIINAAVQQNWKDASLDEALAEFRDAHSDLMGLVGPMSDEELYRAYSDFQPEGEGERDERPIIDMIYVNTSRHYKEHQEWIESLVGSRGTSDE